MMAMQLPLKETIESLMKLVEYTSESAEYFVQKFEKKLKEQNALNSFSDLVQGMWEFAGEVKRQSMLVFDPWRGTRVPSPHENREFQTTALDQMAPSNTQSGRVAVGLEITVGEGKLKRNYLQEIDENTRNALDTLLKAWIVEQGMARQDGIMYEYDIDRDEIKTDARGKQVQVSQQNLQTKIQDSKTGLAAYIREQSKYQVNIVLPPVAEPTPNASRDSGGGI